MDPQFEELAQHLSKVVADQLAAAEKRLSNQFGAAEKRLSNQFGAAEKRLSNRFGTAEKRLKRYHKIEMENLKEHVTLSAEGYGATLDEISRKLQELETKWDTPIHDHGRILKDHNKRIANVERKLT